MLTYIVIGLSVLAAYAVFTRFQRVLAEREKLKEAQRRLKMFEDTGRLPEDDEPPVLSEKRITFRR